jgi:transposase
MRCSSDIRKRVIDFVRGGGSKAEAARRFQVSRASVYNWLSAPDALSYKRPGPRRPRKLDWDVLQHHVKEHDDLTYKERARHFGVSYYCVWYAMHKMGLSRKKNDRVQTAQPYEKKGVSSSS